jgi:hypothetical protein
MLLYKLHFGHLLHDVLVDDFLLKKEEGRVEDLIGFIHKAHRSLYIPLLTTPLGASTRYTPPPFTCKCKHTTKSTRAQSSQTLLFTLPIAIQPPKEFYPCPTIISKYSYSPAKANSKARHRGAQISSKSSCSIFLPSPLRRSKRTVSFRDGLLLLIAMACRPDSLDSRNSRSRSLPTSRACVEAALVMRAIGPQRLRVKVT